jgi:hypothetical protein
MRIRSLLVASVLTITASVNASPAQLSKACEEALALSALPQRLRSSASVYTLTDAGFVRTRAAQGTFTCIVERNHPQALIPQCVDAAGADTIIPALIWRSERALAGATPQAISAEFNTKVARGEFRAPERPGVSYMTSAYNYIYLPDPDRIVDVDPHMMFYAPNLTNDDIGGSFAARNDNRGLPFILEPGIHGYMISYVDHASDPADVQRECAGQIGEAPPGIAGPDLGKRAQSQRPRNAAHDH